MTITFDGEELKNVITFGNMKDDRRPLDIVRLYVEDYGAEACIAFQYNHNDGAIAWFAGIEIPAEIEDIGVMGVHFDSVCAKTVYDMVAVLGFDTTAHLTEFGELNAVWMKTPEMYMSDAKILVHAGN